MRHFETTTELMPWQEAAVNKLKPTKVGGLFMEMGTGKTRSAIELIKRRQHKIDTVVWFCPVSLKSTIYLEILKHTNAKDIYVFDEKTTSDNIPKARWMIIGIESMSSSNRVVFATNSIITDKTFVILDESSYIKGHRAKRTERITHIAQRAKYRFVLTGTPISQGVEDLFSQMKFLSPQILGYRSWYTFANNHLEYSEKHPGLIVRTHDTDQLAAKIAPYVYQVTKEECMSLPGKHYKTKYFKLTDEQRDAYEAAKNEILLNIDLMDDFKPYTIFRLYGVLQQIASGFWNHKHVHGDVMSFYKYGFLEFPDNRLGTLINILPSNEKTIIWAKFRYDINRIVSTLREYYGPDSVAVFTGSTPQKERQAEVEKFRGAAQFFVSTQSCGGHGLTLNEAQHVIFFSNSFKYSERLQAEDRCITEGQLVHTLENGLVPIENVCIGDKVLTHTGEWEKVVKNICKGYTGPMTEINYTRYSENLICTYDHKILVKRGDNAPSWMEAHTVLPGDFLLMPRPASNNEDLTHFTFPESCRHYSDQKNQYGVKQINGRYKQIPNIIEINNELLYLFGRYLAEGFSSTLPGKGRFVSLSGHEKEIEILKRLGNCFDKLNVNWNIFANKKTKGIELRAYSIDLAYLFEHFFGYNCYTKKIPEFLMRLNTFQTLRILNGYTDGDGYKRGKSTEWVTASTCLASHIGLLALKCGYSPTLRNIKIGKNTGQWIGAYTVDGNPANKAYLQSDENYVYNPVRQVTTSFAKRHPIRQKVYDLTVENDHSFVVGQATVHNCHRLGLDHEVTYYDIIGPGIDEKIWESLSRKENVADSFRREVDAVKEDRAKLKDIVKLL